MLRKVLPRLSVLAMVVFGVGAALAQDEMDTTGPLGLDEVRLGIHSHAAYHTFLPLTPWKFRFDDISDISGDLIFETPDWEFMQWLGSPRPQVGATLNFSGKESLLLPGSTGTGRCSIPRSFSKARSAARPITAI